MAELLGLGILLLIATVVAIGTIVIAAMRGMDMKFPPVNFDPAEIVIE